MKCDLKRNHSKIMSTLLNNFFSYTLNDGQELMIEQPPKHNAVITQISLADPANFTKRVTCSAHVETLRIDLPQIDREDDEGNENGEKQTKDFQSIDYDSIIASFCPGDQLTKQVFFGFTDTDICYLKATGGPLIVSGYISPNKVNLTSFQ